MLTDTFDTQRPDSTLPPVPTYTSVRQRRRTLKVVGPRSCPIKESYVVCGINRAPRTLVTQNPESLPPPPLPSSSSTHYPVPLLGCGVTVRQGPRLRPASVAVSERNNVINDAARLLLLDTKQAQLRAMTPNGQCLGIMLLLRAYITIVLVGATPREIGTAQLIRVDDGLQLRRFWFNSSRKERFLSLLEWGAACFLAVH
ncbi:hypothetical protein BGW80DRAFT_1251163 [Lactifluus volemus]|nr:hypothetical protein BGW80DRAFT_1251163 [Lactifluus volemus]